MKGLDADEYQRRVEQTAIYPEVNGTLVGHMVYPVLGLTNEAGEFAGKFKKVIRDKGSVLSHEDMDSLAAELGDVLWYVAECARWLGYPLSVVMAENIAKLQDRAERGKLQGEGDNR